MSLDWDFSYDYDEDKQMEEEYINSRYDFSFSSFRHQGELLIYYQNFIPSVELSNRAGQRVNFDSKGFSKGFLS